MSQTEKLLCGTHCVRWSKKFKRCPKGAVSGKSEVGSCNLQLLKS